MDTTEDEIPISENISINANEQTCRVCLESHESTLSLYDEIEFNDLNVELWQMLENVSNVKVTTVNCTICNHSNIIQKLFAVRFA